MSLFCFTTIFVNWRKIIIMGAGAPYGNRNAEKWTFKKAIKLYDDAIDLSLEKIFVVVRNDDGTSTEFDKGYKYDFIGEIARELGTYHQLITQHLPERFPVLKRKLKVLMNNLESNCYLNGKKGNIKEASAIMNLKSNHKWTDRLDQTSDNKPIQQHTINLQYNGEDIDLS